MRLAIRRFVSTMRSLFLFRVQARARGEKEHKTVSKISQADRRWWNVLRISKVFYYSHFVFYILQNVALRAQHFMFVILCLCQELLYQKAEKTRATNELKIDFNHFFLLCLTQIHFMLKFSYSSTHCASTAKLFGSVLFQLLLFTATRARDIPNTVENKTK